jgi:hypothetical protein
MATHASCCHLQAGLLLAGLLAAPVLHAAQAVSSAQFGLQHKSWTLVDRTGAQQRQYHIPADLPAIARLPASEKKRLLAQVRRHEANRMAMAAAADRIVPLAARSRLHLVPEYRQQLAEVAISVDAGMVQGNDPLHAHEPILRALPAYTRLDVFAPPALQRQVRRSLRQLGFSHRARILDLGLPPRQEPALPDPAPRRDMSAPWIRDTALVGLDGMRNALLVPLAFAFGRGEAARGDLVYLGRLTDKSRELLRTPLFFRAGNVLGMNRPGDASTQASVLFVGETELFVNATGYVKAVDARPPSALFLDELAALAGVRETVLMPNSERLFHVDQYMAVLGDGLVALLNPLDPEHLPTDERRVFTEARARLARHGVRVIDVPTLSEWVAAYQSPVNVVPFVHRGSGQRMALVPRFSDRAVNVNGTPRSLNDLVLEAYRRGGIVPVSVEDRFSHLGGNTHCVVLALK